MILQSTLKKINSYFQYNVIFVGIEAGLYYMLYYLFYITGQSQSKCYKIVCSILAKTNTGRLIGQDGKKFNEQESQKRVTYISFRKIRLNQIGLILIRLGFVTQIRLGLIRQTKLSWQIRRSYSGIGLIIICKVKVGLARQDKLKFHKVKLDYARLYQVKLDLDRLGEVI